MMQGIWVGQYKYYMYSFLSKSLDLLFFRSWWVLLFMILSFMLYEQAMKKRDKDYNTLTDRLHELQTAKSEALKKQEELQLQINSESDPAWVELVLMRELGLVPEEQTKIFFSPSQ